jgi:hypothetical protein
MAIFYHIVNEKLEKAETFAKTSIKLYPKNEIFY